MAIDAVWRWPRFHRQAIVVELTFHIRGTRCFRIWWPTVWDTAR